MTRATQAVAYTKASVECLGVALAAILTDAGESAAVGAPVRAITEGAAWQWDAKLERGGELRYVFS